MTKTYNIETIWHTYSNYKTKSNKRMGKFTGVMFCEDGGHCYGLIKDDVIGCQSLEHNFYFVGHFEPNKGISFIMASVGKNSPPIIYTLVQDGRGGFCGRVKEISLGYNGQLNLNLICGARMKVNEEELTPVQFNYYQKVIEKSRHFIGNVLSANFVSRAETNSEFLMNLVMSQASEIVQYQNSKHLL